MEMVNSLYRIRSYCLLLFVKSCKLPYAKVINFGKGLADG
jgi:hypothetical protein